jgi:hypothetical protein
VVGAVLVDVLAGGEDEGAVVDVSDGGDGLGPAGGWDDDDAICMI